MTHIELILAEIKARQSGDLETAATLQTQRWEGALSLVANKGRTVTEIDRDIDAVRHELQAREPNLRLAVKKHRGPSYLKACQRWQAAWDAHPDLAERQSKLYRERYEASNPPRAKGRKRH